MGTGRSTAKLAALKTAGATPVQVDGLDREAVRRAVVAARPDVIVHQMTSLSGLTSYRNLDAVFILSNRLRTEGTDHLLAAAKAAGLQCLVVPNAVTRSLRFEQADLVIDSLADLSIPEVLAQLEAR